MKKSELGTKRSRDGRRRDPTGENAQIVSSSSSFDEQHGGVLREDLGNTLKREHIYPGNCRQPTENASFAWGGVEVCREISRVLRLARTVFLDTQKVTLSSWRRLLFGDSWLEKNVFPSMLFRLVAGCDGIFWRCASTCF